MGRALCRSGHETHLVCQESRPEDFDFVAAAYAYDAEGRQRIVAGNAEGVAEDGNQVS
jgi:hypothetical protein